MIATALLSVVLAVIVALVFLFVVFLPLFCLIDVVARPSSTFREVGSSKALWVVLLIWLTLLAAVIYLASVRPRLEAAKGLV